MHPDVVGIESISNVRSWNEKVKDISNYYNINKTKIYSYEVKLSLNMGNVREYYFQAVSNSTWANYGYLVIFENPDNEVQSELEIWYWCYYI